MADPILMCLGKDIASIVYRSLYQLKIADINTQYQSLVAPINAQYYECGVCMIDSTHTQRDVFYWNHRQRGDYEDIANFNRLSQMELPTNYWDIKELY
jgi:hypothetical protein